MAFKDSIWQSEIHANEVINSSNPEATNRKSTKSLDNAAKEVGIKNRRTTIQDIQSVLDDYENSIASYNGKSADWLIALCNGDTDTGFSSEINFGAKWFDKETYKSWAKGVKERWESEVESNALDIENAVIQNELKDALSEAGEYWKTKGISLVSDTLGWNPFEEGSWKKFLDKALADVEQTTDYLMSDEYQALILIKQRAKEIRDNPLGYRIHTLSSLHSSPFNTKLMPGDRSTRDNKLRDRGRLSLSKIMIYPDAITKTTFKDSDRWSYALDGTSSITNAYMYSTEDADKIDLDSKYWYGTTNILTPYPQNIYNMFWSDILTKSEDIKAARVENGISRDLKTNKLDGGIMTLTFRQYLQKLDQRSTITSSGKGMPKWNVTMFSIDDRSKKDINEAVWWPNNSNIDNPRYKWDSSSKTPKKVENKKSLETLNSISKEDAYKAGYGALRAYTNEKFVGKDGIDKLFKYDPGTVINTVIMQQCFANGYNMYIHIAPLSYGPSKDYKTREEAVKMAHDMLLKSCADNSLSHRLGIDSKDSPPSSMPHGGVYDISWLLYMTCQQIALAAGASKSLLRKINPDSWNTLVYRAEGITVPKLAYKSVNSKCFGMEIPLISRSYDQNMIATVNFRIDRELAMLYALGIASGYTFNTASSDDKDNLMSMSFTDLLGDSFYKRYAIFISTGHFGSADIARELMHANDISYIYNDNEKGSFALNQSGQKIEATTKSNTTLIGNANAKLGQQEHYHLFHMFNDVKFLGFSSSISLENVAQGKAVSLPVNMTFKDIETLTEHWTDTVS